MLEAKNTFLYIFSILGDLKRKDQSRSGNRVLT